MRILWILAAVFLALVLLSRLWLGIQVRGADGDWQVGVRVGPLRFQLYPPKAKKTGKKPVEESEKRKKVSSQATEKKANFPKVTPELLRSAYREVWPPLCRALSRLRRAVRVDPLDMSVTIGAAEDPPKGAELYGLAQGAVWSGMPVLEQLLEIPNPHIHIGIDFDAPRPQLRLSVGVQVRLGALIAIALGIGLPAIRWYQNSLRCEAPTESTTVAA